MEFIRLIRKSSGGFTLIETLVVLVIIGVLATFAITGFNNTYLNNNNNDLQSFKKFIDLQVTQSIITGETISLNFYDEQITASGDKVYLQSYKLNNIEISNLNKNKIIRLDNYKLSKIIQFPFFYNKKQYDGTIDLNGFHYEKK